MTIPLLENEAVFLDYLDEDYEGWGFKLVDNAPEEAVDALDSYTRRCNRIKESVGV